MLLLSCQTPTCCPGFRPPLLPLVLCPARRYQGMTAEEIQLDRYKKFRTLVSILRGSKD